MNQEAIEGMDSKSIEVLIDVAFEIVALTQKHHKKILDDTPGLVMDLEEVKEYRSIGDGFIEALYKIQGAALYEEGRTDKQEDEVRDFKRKRTMIQWYEGLIERRNYLISRL